MFNLDDKKIIITGASRGLGAVCAQALAKEGACLVLLARSWEALEQVRQSCNNRQKHLSIAVDLTDPTALKLALTKAEEFLGTLDVILHAAGGGLGLHNPLISSIDVERLLSLNLKVPLEINSLLVPKMIQKKRGNLVHIGSIASSEAVASVGYNTAKAALAAYVRSLGRELAGSGIIVTGILPGAFYAPDNSWNRLEKKKPKVVQRFVKECLPRGFLGTAEELVPLILFLCSDNASMMGGCLVPIDAGQGKNYLGNY